VTLRVLRPDSPQLEGLHGFASPLIFQVLGVGSLPSHVVAAYVGQEPVGLAVGFAGLAGEVELASLFVSPFFRRQGIGRTMLVAMEDEFARRGAKLMACMTAVPADDPSFIRFLRACGWDRPLFKGVRCRSTVELALGMQSHPLIDATLPDGYTIVSWADVTPAQRDELRHGGRFQWPREVDPFDTEPDYDRATSLAMLRIAPLPNGLLPIVGWTINHVLDERTLRWTNSFVDPAKQTRGFILPLWLETARRQQALTTLPELLFMARLETPRMARFAERRMRPWMTQMVYSCTILKRFGWSAGV
jgi:GNAT superfamily N-acetyltransferase